MSVIQLLLGLVLLVVGGEGLVRGAAGFARAFGVPSLVIGLTIVSFGTSSPELTVSLLAAFSGSSEIALGNVVGSNIANIGLILGLPAILCPLVVHRGIVRRDGPILLLLHGLLALLLVDHTISRPDGGLLLGAGALYLWLTLRSSRAAADTASPREARLPTAVYVLLAGAGLALLVYGGDVFLQGAVSIAALFGLSTHVIGLTVVAIGTSLPELATSLIAIRRSEMDIAVGNAIGSCILNVMFVLGTAAVVHPLEMPASSFPGLWVDVGVAGLFALALLPMMRHGGSISRREGCALLSVYAAYLAWLVLDPAGIVPAAVSE